ncbi:alpha-2-macroglobulin [bacterium]|nr:alpha-2-macroglobulin [bacterium]
MRCSGMVAVAGLALVTAGVFLSMHGSFAADSFDEAATRKQSHQAFKEGNWADALAGFQKLAGNPASDENKVPEDLRQAVDCQNRLGRQVEFDKLIEETITAHSKSWRVLREAGRRYRDAYHFGFVVSGEFERGGHRGNGRQANAFERDRVRSLQLFDQAWQLAVESEASNDEIRMIVDEYAQAIRSASQNAGGWTLQRLTDLETLPDYEEGYWYGYRGPQSSGAPADADGNPVFYSVPESFAAATSDGERWRWLLTEAARLNPHWQPTYMAQYADFLWSQFGVQTLASYGWWGRQADDAADREAGKYSVHTLSDDETIAKLATGVRRFRLPDEHNFVRIYRSLAAPDNAQSAYAREQLAQIYENRRQYPKAAAEWQASITQHGPGSNNYRQQRLDQIVGNWGQFETTRTQPAGNGAIVDYRYRNGASVEFEAFPIDIAKLLGDVKAYLKSNPQQIDWQSVNLGQIGHSIVTENQQKYVGERVAQWSLKLDPADDHSDRRVTVRTPLQAAGAYLVNAKIADGNTSRIVLWVDDTVIVKKPLDGEALYFVADAASGEPIERANVEYFGWWSETKQQPRQHIVHTRNFAEFSDANGIVRLPERAEERNFQWLTIARTQQGRLAYHGFDRIWFGRRYDREYNENKTFVITDRPVYRPGQTVQFKFWVRHAQYDQQDVSQFAGQQFGVRIANPKGEKLLQETMAADEYGGLSSEFVLDEDAALGNWSIYLEGHGGSSFRVEEYKKPEFEVSIEAPSKPVQLGENITATITAKYYFGAPVTKARVKYKVLRSTHDSRWFPRGEWDWFYGRGYWWFAYDYAWYPGWSRWGCLAPSPWWWPRVNDPPEVVTEAEAQIGPDGTLAVEIDTELAKEMHGDQDHRYEITAEVVDESRRTIVGKGEVLVAREPFKVFAWVNRGHFKTGDAVVAEFQAQTLDQKPVTGTGELTLFKVGYFEAGRTDGKPREQAVETWQLNPNEEGRARQQFKAAEPGQYRLSYKVTDAAGHTIEGGYLFNVTGDGFNGETFRFNDLELIPDKREYRAGETVRLMINSARRNANVLLFLRPTNGVYLPPKLLRVDGRSTVEEFAVAPRDMPNFFVEAVTVFDAQVHSETRELVVPPEKRVLNVEVLPSAEEYKPGEEASVRVRVTDHDGKPFVGSTAMSVYDRSVEYISGGSNVPEIREFFWKWRRHHNPQTQSSLDRWSGPVFRPGEVGMSNIGVFGDIVVENRLAIRGRALRKGGTGTSGRMSGFGGGGGVGGGGAFGGALPQAALASEALKDQAVAADAAPAGDAQSTANIEPTVRSNFADTAFWTAALTTDENGEATVTFPMAESLTAWKIRVWGMGHGTRVGEGTAEVVTAKKLLVRLQAPRFFVERDEVVLSANVHNYLDEDKQVDVALELDGGTLESLEAPLTQRVMVPADGEQRVDWRVKVTAEGEAIVRMKALTDEESDAMQMTFPCFVHGILKTESFSGVVRRDETSQSITVRVPEERRPDQSRLEIRYSPTLAGAMVDALPYLVSYPYGCTEQTLNRFVPTVITHSILRNMDLDLQAIRDKRTNLNAQEIGDDRQRRERWKMWDRNPVFDEVQVTRMVKSGVERLTSMQNSDGGWGWFSGFGEHSYPHTTAVVVHGLAVAQENDAALVPGTLERGIEWLKRYQAAEIQKLKNSQLDPKVKPWKDRATDLDALVFSTLARDANQPSTGMEDFLYRDRTHLSVYGKVLFALTLVDDPTDERLAMLKRNIEQFVVEDDENQTAYLRLPEGTWWWSWWGNDLEANAWYLKLLAATDPKSPRAAGLAKYLLNNRHNGDYWRSTRETAYCIEALADYLRASDEDRPDMTIEVLIDGQSRKSVRITAENLFSFENQFVLEGDELTSGEHIIEVRRQGTGPVYFNAYVTNFTLEEFITKAGLEVKVQRQYFRLKRVDATAVVAGARGQVVSQKIEKYEREVLDDLATVTSGDLIEVELEIESKNDYEYLVFEDPKAAGFEPVDLRSGYTGNEMGAYVEYHDEKVALFVRALPRGLHSVSYRLRAEIPGMFHALPTQASAMYAPELKANSDEIRLSVTD